MSAEQERELVRRAGAYSGPWRHVVRAKASLLAAEGASNQAIADRLEFRTIAGPTGLDVALFGFGAGEERATMGASATVADRATGGRSPRR